MSKKGKNKNSQVNQDPGNKEGGIATMENETQEVVNEIADVVNEPVIEKHEVEVSLEDAANSVATVTNVPADQQKLIQDVLAAASGSVAAQAAAAPAKEAEQPKAESKKKALFFENKIGLLAPNGQTLLARGIVTVPCTEKEIPADGTWGVELWGNVAKGSYGCSFVSSKKNRYVSLLRVGPARDVVETMMKKYAPDMSFTA